MTKGECCIPAANGDLCGHDKFLEHPYTGPIGTSELSRFGVNESVRLFEEGVLNRELPGLGKIWNRSRFEFNGLVCDA